MLSPRVHWVQGVGLFLVLVPSCTKPPEKTPPTEAGATAVPEPEAALLGDTLEVVITQRSYIGWGSANKITMAGERGMLYASVATPLSAAMEANDVLTLVLSTAPATEADRPKGALERDGVTYRVASFTGWMQPADTVSHDTLVGVWRVPKTGRERWSPAGPRTASVPQFAYDGKFVVLRLFSEKEWMGKTKDDRYKLESRWETQPDGREVLQYRTPFGGWETLAAMAFEGKARRFVLAESDATWPLERVRKPADADEDDRALVAPRPAHDYATKPMNPRP